MFLLSSDLDGVLGLQFPLSDVVFTIARQPTCANRQMSFVIQFVSQTNQRNLLYTLTLRGRESSNFPAI